MSKRPFTIILSISFCFIIQCKSQSTKEFTIYGELKGVDNNTVELSIKRDWSFFPYRTEEIKNGVFKIQGKIYNPTFATLKLELDNSVEVLDFFIEEGITTITGDRSLTSAKIEGGAEQKLFQEFNSRVINLRESGDYNQLRKETIGFIRQYPKSFVSLFLVDTFDEMNNSNADEIQTLFKSLHASVRKSRIGKAIEGTIEKRQKYPLGANLKDFELPDHKGKNVRISELDFKAIILDFGASWCGPCKYEYPFFKKIYKRYRDKGLEIATVSLDKKREPWLKLIEEEALPWIHLSDLKGFESEAAVLYDIQAIPSNFLIDGSGKIRSVDRHGEDLLKNVIKILDQ